MVSKKSGSMTIDLKQEAKWLKDAERFCKQENYTQALACYRNLMREGAPEEIKEQIHYCQAKLMRRFWKQGRADFFATSMASFDWTERLALAFARMEGDTALESLIDKEQGLNSHLAACTREKNLNMALKKLRQLTLYKEMAEGWLSLLKEDRALAGKAFGKAEQKTPYAASIGKVVSALVSGELDREKQLLEPLRPFLSQRFPELDKALHQNQEQLQHRLFLQLFAGSSREIQEGLKQHTLPDTLKGWLSLRLGDRLCLEYPGTSAPWGEILEFWKQAAHLHEGLKIDVAKRRLLTAGKRNNPLFFVDEWRALCKLLEKQAPEHIKEFLQQLAHTPSMKLMFVPLSAFRANPAASFEKQNWLLANPPSSFYLLFCRFAAMQLQCLDKCLQFPRDFSPKDLFYFFSVIRPKDSPWDQGYWAEIENALPLLDQEYEKDSLYLQIRYSLARIAGDSRLMRQILYRRMRQDPDQKEQLMPSYLQALFQNIKKEREIKALQKHGSLKEMLDHYSARQELLQELTDLIYRFPADYDLMRLFLVCNTTKQKICDQQGSYTLKLSKPLQQVMCCQLMNDYGSSKKTLLSFLPDWKEMEGSAEAQLRWLQLAMTPTLEPSLRWQIAIEELPQEKLHTLLKQLEKRGEATLPQSVLDALKAAWGDSPYVSYHKGLQELESLTSYESLPGILQELDAVVGKLPVGSLDRDSVCTTVQLFSVCFGVRTMLAKEGAAAKA